MTYDEWIAAQELAEQAALEAEQAAWPRFWTNAPEAYDGFGTATIETTGLTYEGRSGPYDFPFRRIRVHPDHVRWQADRNSSGLYVTLTTEAWAQFLLDRKVAPRP